MKERLKNKTPEDQKSILQNLAFHAIMMDLTDGLNDYLDGDANIRLRVSGKEIETIDVKY